MMAAPPAAPPAASIFIKRVCPTAPLTGEAFAKLALQPSDVAADLGARACAAFPRWGVDAGQVRLALAAAGGDEEPSVEAEATAAPLSAAARVAAGAWLLALVPPPPPPGAFTAADVRAAVEAALADSKLLRALKPFAREHHSDATSHSSPSPSQSKAERRAFKVSVADFYGLGHSNDPDMLTDMLGDVRPFHEVTLAHLWPASYSNFGDYAREMALPAGFHEQPRNFLLLPRDVHEAFDMGHIAFVPKRDGAIVLRVLRAAGLPAPVAGRNGVRLCLPSGKAPFRRTLGWFAWLAKGAADVSPGVHEELHEALDATDSHGGKAAARRLWGRAVAASEVSV